MEICAPGNFGSKVMLPIWCPVFFIATQSFTFLKVV